MTEIHDAMGRSIADRRPIPGAWVEEFCELNENLREQERLRTANSPRRHQAVEAFLRGDT